MVEMRRDIYIAKKKKSDFLISCSNCFVKTWREIFVFRHLDSITTKKKNKNYNKTHKEGGGGGGCPQQLCKPLKCFTWQD